MHKCYNIKQSHTILEEKMPKILKNKLFLYLTEFFAGMSVMAVELGASRLLAPYFSSSQIVWTIIIGTIMIAMALGNIYGGKTSDKSPDPGKLYVRILIAAIWIAAIPLVGKYIILGISALLVFKISTGFLIWAAFAACMVIFVFPLFLLGTVTPSLAKYTMDNLEDNGKTIGTLGAFNTVGSIIGTFLPTFVTIPAVGTAVTFLIFASVLAALSIVYFVSAKKHFIKSAAAIIIIVVSFFLSTSSGFAFWETSLLYEGESIYNYLQVKEDSSSVILSTNVLFGVQSIKMKDDHISEMYYDYAMMAPLMADVTTKDDFDILILGMGTGTYACECRKYFGDVHIDGVEIDAKITDLSRKYFDLPDDINVVTYDGRAYLNASDDQYDVILVDAYQDISIPFQMSSTEFFSGVKDHLKEGGVMVVNMNMKGSSENGITEYLSDTVSAIFDSVYVIDCARSTNRELFACAGDVDLQAKVFASVPDMPRGELRSFIERHSERLFAYENGDLIMTDDKAPVELLSMQVIDELIKDEVSYYKKIYDEDGLQGIIDSLF